MHLRNPNPEYRHVPILIIIYAGNPVIFSLIDPDVRRQVLVRVIDSRVDYTYDDSFPYGTYSLPQDLPVDQREVFLVRISRVVRFRERVKQVIWLGVLNQWMLAVCIRRYQHILVWWHSQPVNLTQGSHRFGQNPLTYEERFGGLNTKPVGKVLQLGIRRFWCNRTKFDNNLAWREGLLAQTGDWQGK